MCLKHSNPEGMNATKTETNIYTINKPINSNRKFL